MNKTIVTGLLAVALSCSAPPSSADDGYWMSSAKKLGFGFVNAVTAGAELPKNIYLSTTQADFAYLPITPFFGVIKGVGDTIGRTLAAWSIW